MIMNKYPRGTLYIIASPSGGGKSSLIARLLESTDNLELSVSHTTRDKRSGEVEGVHYYFIGDAEFKRMIDEKAFIEHASVFSHYYGTSKVQIERRLSQGIDVVLDIDWQGAKQLRQLFQNTKSIYILPPSLDVLRQRLSCRGRESEELIASRMEQARDEIEHYIEFDYLVINDDFAQALSDVKSIVQANRLKIDVQRKNCAKILSLLLGST